MKPADLLGDKLKAAQAVIDAAHEVSLYAVQDFSYTDRWMISIRSMLTLKEALRAWREATDKLNERDARDKKRGLT